MSRNSKEIHEHPQAADQRIVRATTEGVDAQNATQFDMDRGLAGVEAKPFSERAQENSASTEVGKETHGSAKREEDLISGRRNAGREDGAESKRNT
nr:hypothetical protein [Novosphingobium panipatense]